MNFDAGSFSGWMSALPTSLPPPLPFLPSKLRLLFRECTAIFYAPSHIIPHTRSSLHRWRSSSGFLKFCRNKIGEQGTVSTKGFYRFPRQSGTTSRSEVGLVIAIGKKKSCAKNPRLIPHPVSLTGFGVGVVSHRGHLKREEIRGPARDLSDSNPSFLPLQRIRLATAPAPRTNSNLILSLTTPTFFGFSSGPTLSASTIFYSGHVRRNEKEPLPPFSSFHLDSSEDPKQLFHELVQFIPSTVFFLRFFLW